MNDRIKELMNEAVRFHWDHDGQAYEAQVHPEDLEYFAELIIKECADFVYNYPEKYLTRDQAREISLSMEKLFGVEE